MIWLLCFLSLLTAFTIFSYGFVDLNLHLSTNHLYVSLQKPLSDLIFIHRPLAALIFIIIVGGLYGCYVYMLRQKDYKTVIRLKLPIFFLLTAGILFLSFPALTYDIFNYILTAKVAFHYHENPYVVMPIEITNEPMLQYTRAANKLALYGPTWLLLTWVPHVLSFNSIVLAIFSFKFLNVLLYFLMLKLLYSITKDVRQVLFFGLNPLVLIEVLISSHNDISMMILALFAIHISQSDVVMKRYAGYAAYVLSIFVKGATIVLAPLFFMKLPDKITLYTYAYWLMFAVFLLTPFREELYPWYALWFVTFAAVIPMKKKSFIHGFTIALCIGLSFRHLPYIYTREYGGYGPLARKISTAIPTSLYLLWWVKSHFLNKIHQIS